jgi:outer membrane protein assembly factor BamB
MKPLPNIEVLREMLAYDAESGELRWKVKPSWGVKVGDIAGTLTPKGYIKVKVKGKIYLAHRVAWALHYGEDTELYIDHKDGEKSNNRIANLRLATSSENNYNIGVKSNNTSGHRGVSKHRNKWEVRLGKNYIGTYDCVEDAINARLTAEADNNIYVCAR